jgi:hypothetical protein
MRSFLPPGEAAQADYERLREAALCGVPLLEAISRRFDRGGFAALIAAPASSPCFAAELAGALRPGWTPYGDPRVEALAEGYGFLLGASPTASAEASSKEA